MIDELDRHLKKSTNGYSILLNCSECGNEFYKQFHKFKKNKKHFCCFECVKKHRKGVNNQNWKGGKRKTSLGYIVIYEPLHPYADVHGNIFEHRILMEKKLERYLTKDEVVHHINGIKTDNRIENLLLFENNQKHLDYHRNIKE